jgi:hypothetical protein
MAMMSLLSDGHRLCLPRWQRSAGERVFGANQHNIGWTMSLDVTRRNHVTCCMLAMGLK